MPSAEKPSLVLRLKRIVLKAVVRLHRGRVVTTEDGLAFTVFDDWIMGRVIWKKSYEKDWTDRIRRFLSAGDTCIDVGANFGYYTVFMASLVGPSGRVIAIEPNPRLAPVIDRNLELNQAGGSVELHRVGVGPEAARGAMRNDAASSGLGYVEPLAGGGGIEITTLDALAARDAGAVAFLKIDIEGGEVGALAGASGLLGAPGPPVVLCEFNASALSRDGAPDDLWRLFDGHGYDVYNPGQRTLEPCVPVSARASGKIICSFREPGPTARAFARAG